MFNSDQQGVGESVLEDVQNANDLAALISTYTETKTVNGIKVTYTYLADGTPISATAGGATLPPLLVFFTNK